MELILRILVIVMLVLLLFLTWKNRQLTKQLKSLHSNSIEPTSESLLSETDRHFDLDNYNEKLISLLRNYRHDWLNHMQVILGYVSLKKLDKISAYISHVNEQSVIRTLISKLKAKNLAVFLFMIPIEYPKVQVQLELTEEITDINFQEIESWILANLQFFFELLQSEGFETHLLHSVILSLSSLENEIVVNIEYEGDFSPYYQQMIQQGETVKQQGGEFFIDLYNDQEFIVEFHFPIEVRGVA